MAKDLEIYSLKEIQDLLQVSRRTLYNWIKDGKLQTFKAGREWRVTRQALDSFLEAGTEQK